MCLDSGTAVRRVFDQSVLYNFKMYLLTLQVHGSGDTSGRADVVVGNVDGSGGDGCVAGSDNGIVSCGGGVVCVENCGTSGVGGGAGVLAGCESSINASISRSVEDGTGSGTSVVVGGGIEGSL